MIQLAVFYRVLVFTFCTSKNITLL